MAPTDRATLAASVKKDIKLTVPNRIGQISFILKTIDPNKRMADKYAHELRRREPDKIVKVMKRKLRYATTYAVYISKL